MPIYEYKCNACDTLFEKLVRASSKPDDLSCPSCGDQHLSQQYSTFAARANGIGAEPQATGCGGGMCRTPGMCGIN